MRRVFLGLFLILNILEISSALANEALTPNALMNNALMDNAGCVACHRVDTKYNGPAFRAVAARYKNDPEAPALLFAKVREGGEGVWGDLPMVPNGPNKISDADLQTLITWILAL